MNKEKEEEKTYYGGMLPEVTAIALREQLLEISGEYYFYNPGYWIKAMRYMQRLGDTKAEQRIFNKSFNYGRERDAKRVLLLFGGIAGVLYAPALLGRVAVDTGQWLTHTSAGKAMGVYKATTYWRMGINAGTQTLLAGGDFREIDCVSVGAEMMPPWANALSPMMEIRPSSEESTFKFIFYNKTASETFFDITANQFTGKIDSKISSFVKRNIGNSMNDELIKRLMNNLAFPTCNSGFQLGTSIITGGVKETLNLSPKDEIPPTR